MKKAICFAVCVAVVPLFLAADATGVWTALGDNEKTTTRQNWENDEIPSGIGVTFGAAGSRALLSESLSATGIQFVPASANRYFTIENDASAPDGTKLLVGSGGITVQPSAGSSLQTNVISSPIEFTAGSATLGGSTKAKDTLRIKGPISSSGSVAITANGPDTLWLEGTSDFTGSFKSTQGTRYIASGSLGDAGNTAEFSQNSGNANVYFLGGNYDQRIDVKRTSGGSASGYNISAYFKGSTNHVFSKRLKMADGGSGVAVYAERGAKILFNAGVTTDSWDYRLMLYGYYGASYTVTNGTLNTKCNGGVLLYAYGAMSLNLWSSNNTTRLSSGSASPGAYYLVGPVTVNTYAKWAFNTNYLENKYVAIPLTMLIDKASSSTLSPTFNMRGNDQFVGNLSQSGSGFTTYIASDESKVTSPSPATLFALQKTTNTVSFIFEDAASLCKHGVGKLTLSGISTTTGRLEVADGVLAFSGSGSWPSATSVAVSGGTLNLDAADRINPKASLYYSSGSINIAEDVTVVVDRMFVSDGDGWKPVAGGVYDAQSMPGCIDGLGRLRVKHPSGCVLIIR